ncbi:hypothetical protein EDB84DRAFT_1525368 [Lactarius hengduanensis]|nr:hypothetical protein EDB84DRAFT_1525368 [Lactarius hengduanensis]
MITNRTLAFLRFASAHLLDRLAANQIVRVKHEQYGGRLVGYLESRAGLRLQLFLHLAVPGRCPAPTWIATSVTCHRYILVR